jgi:hypothetical protein
MKRQLVALLAAGILLTGAAWAQDQENDDSDQAPERGVARISLVNGDVSVRRGDAGEWVAAAVNAPMVVYDHLLTGPASQAEIQFDYANYLRLNSDSEVRLSDLQNGRFQVQVVTGTVTLAVISDSNSQMEVDTPSVAIQPTKSGMYRVTVSDDGQTEVTVRFGEAELSTQRGSQRLAAGQTMLLRGPANDPEFQIVQAAAMDDWDRWNEARDQSLSRSRSYEYVSRDIYGANNLDSYGRWVYVAPYGWVWNPNGVGPDWAPYRDGRWSWLDWYGWTWISYEPWGWAPYHYGRWFEQPGYGWCWFPGPIHHRHYWRPGLVAFFGFGRGVGVGFGSIGWVPLAPYERYHPWYGRRWYGNGARNHVYISNNIDITRSYRNARVVNAVSGINADGFGRGGHAFRIPERDFRSQRVSLVTGPVPVAPGAGSLHLSNRAVRIAPQRERAQRFYSPRPAPAVQRVPFNVQRQNAEQYVHRSFSTAPGQTPQVMRNSPAVQRGNAQGFQANRPQDSTSGWRRMQGQPPGQAAPENRGDWRRFGGQSQSTYERPQNVQPSEQRQQQQSWRQYGNRGEAPAYQPPSNTGRDQGRFSQRNDTVRINPPIVRERPSSGGDRSYRPERSSGGGGGNYSRSSGGGGGGGRSSGGGGRSGGGGGGGHSGGGGGHSGGGGGGGHHR